MTSHFGTLRRKERRWGRVENFHSLQISEGPFSVPNNVAICCMEMLRSFGWGFKANHFTNFRFIVHRMNGSFCFDATHIFCPIYEEAPFMIAPYLNFTLRPNRGSSFQCLGDRVSWRLHASNWSSHHNGF